MTVLINGDGSAREELERRAAGLPNIRFAGYVPEERLPELLATGDVHAVPLRRGLGRVSVPSKTYSILAAGRPVVAAIDAGTEVPRILAASGAGIAVPPDDPDRVRRGRRGARRRPRTGASRWAGADGRGCSARRRRPPSPRPTSGW